MLTTIFATIKEAAGSLVSTIGSVLESVAGWFYVEGSGEVAGHLTFVGILSVIALVGSIVFFVVRWIRGLISMRRAM